MRVEGMPDRLQQGSRAQAVCLGTDESVDLKEERKEGGEVDCRQGAKEKPARDIPVGWAMTGAKQPAKSIAMDLAPSY